MLTPPGSWWLCWKPIWSSYDPLSLSCGVRNHNICRNHQKHKVFRLSATLSEANYFFRFFFDLCTRNAENRLNLMKRGRGVKKKFRAKPLFTAAIRCENSVFGGPVHKKSICKSPLWHRMQRTAQVGPSEPKKISALRCQTYHLR